MSALAPLLKSVTLCPKDTLAKRPPALRIVLSGEMKVKRPWRVLPHGEQVLRRGSVLGLKTLARWKTGEALRSEDEAEDIEALVLTELLELPREQFKTAFHHKDTLLDRLLAAREADESAVEIVRVLSESPRLANAQDADLFRLVEGATPVKVHGGSEATPLFLEPAIPDGFYVVLEGCCDISSSSAIGPFSKLVAPTCVGLDEFLLRKPLPGAVMLRPVEEKWARTFRRKGMGNGNGARAFHISREWFDHVRGCEPDFNRAVLRGCPEDFQAPPLHPAHQVIVWGEQAEGLPPWSDLGELLAERMAVHLHEHVLVVRLKEDAQDTPLEFVRPAKDRNGWVAHCERLPIPTDGEPLLPKSTMTTWMTLPRSTEFAGRTNVTLVDTSALTARGRQEVLQHLAERASAEEPIKYLSLSKDRQHPTLELPRPIERVHAGLIDFPRPEPGLRPALAGIFRKPKEPGEWPMGTVRLRFPDPWLKGGSLPTSLDAPGLESPREFFDRWARAATGRRVGLALGGGGPFGFASIALLNKLEPADPVDGKEALQPRVPIDMVSGSSFGAVVGAFYCVGGRRGLDMLIRQAHTMRPIVGLTALSSAILEQWTNLKLGPWPLDQLEVPFFPVVTDADIGVEWDLRTGSIGRGVRASSALPPLFGPTLIGNRRLLDGGLVANVPSDVLRAEGADILISANPISRVPPRSRSYPRRWVGPLWRQLSLGMRIKDGLRLFQIIGRLAGTHQNRDGDAVVYQPQLSPATLLGFGNGKQIVDMAQSSPEVDAAVLGARTAWNRRLNNPRWLRLDGGSNGNKTPEKITLLIPIVFQDLAGRSEFASTSKQVLAELVEYLHTQKEITSFQIRLTAPDEHIARQRAQALKNYLERWVFQMPEVKSTVLLTQNSQEKATKDLASRVELIDLRRDRALTQDVMQAAASVMENYRGDLLELQRVELQRVQAAVEMRTLLSEAEQQGRQGAPELARRLALDAVKHARPLLAD
ncbi:patatin-like phospholipase family protein, partial [Corallococcus sicarius]|uniref:patatin-like phospholipase family protein n=1 Tax=Corallococcus sicarius TaxID=2316726 RepID=UPI0031344191